MELTTGTMDIYENLNTGPDYNMKWIPAHLLYTAYKAYNNNGGSLYEISVYVTVFLIHNGTKICA